VSKSVLSALVGIAIAEGHLQGIDQPITPFFAQHLGPGADPRKQRITIGNLLSMQSGLEPTSFGNYGAWVSSPNWVRYAITRPMVADPGGRMLYSTGSTHLLSAILTRATGQSTLAYARAKLAEPLGIRMRSWPTDPQGIYFGGNEMQFTPHEMLRLGELYRNGGVYQGRQIIPADWIRESWQPRTVSPWNGHRYGYGWWMRDAGQHRVYFAWGYGGQYIFVVPGLELTVVTTSDPDAPSRDGGHLRAVHNLIDEWIIPAAEAGDQRVQPG
jgi:CubicO group peptidase (beta-lactamase class C family)